MTKWRRALMGIGILGLAAVNGCANGFTDSKDPSRPPLLIPANAQRVAEGPAPLSYVPTGASTVYILDNSSQALMNTSDVKSGDDHLFIFIDPVEKSVLLKSTVNPTDRIVLASPIDPTHRFSIWVVTPSMLRAMPITSPATQP